MITCDEIKNDPYIIEMYNKIDELSNTQLWATHGWSHVLNVMHTVEIVMKSLNYNDEMIECGRVAALLHDIGCIYGKENHAVNSYNIVSKYFEDKDITDEYKNIILDAILDHSEGKNSNNIINPALLFADKIDYDKTRLTPLGYDIENFNEIQYVDKIEIELNENELIVTFLVTDKFNKDSLEKYYFTPKIFKAIHNFSKYLNLKPSVKINDKDWELELIY